MSGVRAVLGRMDPDTAWAGVTDRLAATLSFYWAEHAKPGSPLAGFAQTGAISEATVDALYADLVALEQAVATGSPAARGSGWTTEAVVRALLDYAAVHRPRGPVSGWTSLRDDRIAARVFGPSVPGRP